MEQKQTFFEVFGITERSFGGKNKAANTATSTRSSIVSRHPGWKTTENNLKMMSNVISLSQTTMSKLEAFRYHPARQQEATVSPVLPAHGVSTLCESPSLEKPHPKELRPCSKHDPLPSADCVYSVTPIQNPGTFQKHLHPAQENDVSHSDTTNIQVLPKGDPPQKPYLKVPNILDCETMIAEDLSPSDVDEFEDGLDDLDLLEVLSGDPMLDMDLGTASHSKDAKRLGLVSISPPRANAKNLRPTISNTPSRNLPPNQVSRFEFDDEYPMDEGDEEEMLMLPELTGGNLEPLVPNYRQFGTGEVYENVPSLSSHIPSSRTVQGAVDNSLPPSSSVNSQLSVRHLRSRPRPNEYADESRTKKAGQLTLMKSGLEQSVPKSPSPRASTSLWRGDPDYVPLQSFARPDFPTLVANGSPVIGLLSHTFLRTCFKIGEMFKEGKRCSSLGQDAIVELFARVTSSSREPGTKKQSFVFVDLWRDNPPFPEGTLMNYNSTQLVETESMAFVGLKEAKMARCLGRLKRDVNNSTGWSLHINMIRETDWEEVRYTKAIVAAGGIKSEAVQSSSGTI